MAFEYKYAYFLRPHEAPIEHGDPAFHFETPLTALSAMTVDGWRLHSMLDGVGQNKHGLYYKAALLERELG